MQTTQMPDLRNPRSCKRRAISDTVAYVNPVLACILSRLRTIILPFRSISFKSRHSICSSCFTSHKKGIPTPFQGFGTAKLSVQFLYHQQSQCTYTLMLGKPVGQSEPQLFVALRNFCTDDRIPGKKIYSPSVNSSHFESCMAMSRLA